MGSDRGRTLLFVREIDDLEAQLIPGTRGGSSVFLSPDGEWLGFVNTQGRIMKVALDGGTPVPIAAAGRRVSGATWTDDGFVVYSASGAPTSDSAGLMMVSADGGTPRILTVPDSVKSEESHRLPFFIPGANAVVFTIWYESLNIRDARVAVLDLASGEITEVGSRFGSRTKPIASWSRGWAASTRASRRRR